MKNKPSWGFWLAALLAYTILDMILAILLHGGPKWSQLPGALQGAAAAATVTWAFALWRWHKADAGL